MLTAGQSCLSLPRVNSHRITFSASVASGCWASSERGDALNQPRDREGERKKESEFASVCMRVNKNNISSERVGGNETKRVSDNEHKRKRERERHRKFFQDFPLPVPACLCVGGQAY